MKKVYLLFIVLTVSLLKLQAQCTGFSDGFESGTYTPTWLTGTGTYTRAVTPTLPAVGTYSFEQACSAPNSFYEGTYTIFTPFQPGYISWYAKTNTTTAANGYMVSGDGNILADNGIIFCYFNATSGLRFYGTTGYNHPIVANTWYHIEAKDIDYVNRNMDIYVDGALILTNWPFRSPSATTFDRIHLFSLSASIVNYDAFIWGYEAPVINSGNVTNIDCFGNTNGSIDLTATAGPINGYLLYSWSNSDTTQDISGLAGGSYTITVTDSVGCVSVDSFMVYEPAPLSSSGIVTNNSCNGDLAGAVDLTVSGGTPGTGYTYLWSNGNTLQDLTNVPGGNYFVDITDSNGCVLIDTFNIVEPTAINVVSLQTDLDCNNDASGSIDLTVSGGSPGYTFNWDNADTTEDISGLAAGTYIVTVTDTNGCTEMGTITLTEPSPITSSATSTSDNGTNNGTIDLTVTGGTPGYDFSWSNSATTEDLSGLAAGNYIVTITDTNGCTGLDTVVVFSTAGLDGNPVVMMNIWPNPFTDVINLHFTEISNVTTTLLVADVNGKTVASYVISPGIINQQISLDESISSGVYFLSLHQGEKSFVVKMIKE